jgi:hypothetical protein
LLLDLLLEILDAMNPISNLHHTPKHLLVLVEHGYNVAALVLVQVLVPHKVEVHAWVEFSLVEILVDLNDRLSVRGTWFAP